MEGERDFREGRRRKEKEESEEEKSHCEVSEIGQPKQLMKLSPANCSPYSILLNSKVSTLLYL